MQYLKDVVCRWRLVAAAAATNVHQCLVYARHSRWQHVQTPYVTFLQVIVSHHAVLDISFWISREITLSWICPRFDHFYHLLESTRECDERENNMSHSQKKCITVAVFLCQTHPGGLWRLQQQYSKLATFAQDLLSVPASQAYVESSVCGLLTPERRNGMNKSRENAYCARNSKMLRDSGFVFQSHFTDYILFWQSVALFVSPVNSTH